VTKNSTPSVPKQNTRNGHAGFTPSLKIASLNQMLLLLLLLLLLLFIFGFCD
jgi:hypothetical protein